MPPVLDKYCPHFPTILFLCSDDTHSMNFILSLEHMPDTQKKTLVELMHHCGAKTSFNVDDATDHSAIIVDHNEVVNFKAPAFTIKYLEDCLELLKVQNILNYRQDATKHIAKDVDCMDVVYFRRKSWEMVLTKADVQWFKENINSSKLDLEPSCSRVGNLDSINAKLGSSEHLDDSLEKEIEPEETNQNRLFSDDESLLNDLLSLEADNVNHAKNDLQIHSGSKKSGNSKELKESKNVQCKAIDTKTRNGTLEDLVKQKKTKRRAREIDSKSSTSSQPSKWSFLDEFQSESSDEEELQPKVVEKEKKKSFLDEFQSESSDVEELQPKVVEKEKKKTFFDFEAADEEDVYKPSKDKKHTRLPYSYDEQSKILKYIIEHCEYTRIKGRELWMVMERRKVCPNRTWQSMKEHFVKKIVVNLEAFDFLSESHKTKIKSVVF